jgi:general secretion pathway protein I
MHFLPFAPGPRSGSQRPALPRVWELNKEQRTKNREVELSDSLAALGVRGAVPGLPWGGRGALGSRARSASSTDAASEAGGRVGGYSARGRRRGRRRGRGTGRGFTLLEVLVAIAILGLGLTVILSSQVGLFSSAQRAENLTQATNLLRCKMNEVELDLIQKGYPLVEAHDEGPCCEEDSDPSFRCAWKVDRVELPQPKGLDTLASEGKLDDSGGLGPMAALASLQQTGGAALGEKPTTSDLANTLAQASGGSMQGMASIAMSLVYPDLKPMLEASIRKVTVTVTWKEGRNQRELVIEQYVTNPQQGGLDPNASKGLQELGDALGGGSSPLGPFGPAPKGKP